MKKKTTKRPKKKKSQDSSSDQTNDSEDSSSSSSQSSSSEAPSEDGSEHSGTSRKRKRSKKARKAREKVDWELLNIAWPIEDRPEHLRKKKNVRGRDIDALVRLKKEVAEVEEKKELGEEVFSRDAVLKKTKYKAGSDNGFKKLHPARGCRQPLAVPSQWYSKLIPRKREHVIRNFPLEHYGMAGQISEKVLGKAHNRSVSLTFDQFCRNSASSGDGARAKEPDLTVQQLQEAVVNYAVVLHALWPSDYSALVILRVLVEAKWGDVANTDTR